MKVFVDANLLIYLNTVAEPSERMLYDDYYVKLVMESRAYTDALVIDELLFISRRKYNVPYEVTLELIESVVKPYVTILPIGEEELDQALNVIRRYGLKPSDAIHVGVMRVNGLDVIVSEDRKFDGIEGVRRIWMGKEGQ